MNHLIIWKECSLFIGMNERSIAAHQHLILQLIIGVDETFLWKNKKGDWEQKKALLIAPNHRHECNANGQTIFVIGIDPASTLGQHIQVKLLGTSSIIDFPLAKNKLLSIQHLMSLIQEENWQVIHQKMESLFGFDAQNTLSIAMDERIKKVLEFILANIDKSLTTSLLMQVACLSESRLLHLFKQEMGLPIRNYILWCRIQKAFQAVLNGYSLTKAAYYAGFADQAHLTRTFVKTIGIPPSAIVKNSKFIQVSFPV